MSDNELYSDEDEDRYVDDGRPRSKARSQFRRDFARVIHCPSFRRLQGKTQLFPGHESDFFRNRLTHSLEVGQIAESIAYCINDKHPYFQKNPIDPRICLTASLLHDIGHPPFGHNGEEALDEKMREFGGFEGNAQTLRIVTQIEKKVHNPKESCPIARRAGLNLTYRTLGAVLKYDTPIPEKRAVDASVAKGYYFEDAPVVTDIKKHVVPKWSEDDGPFKTIECSIMDLADDIAYSTYDLEDSFKAGFLTPAKLLASDEGLLEKVALQVSKKIDESGFSKLDVLSVFSDLFRNRISEDTFRSLGLADATEDQKIASAMVLIEQLELIASSGEIRTSFTSDIVGELVDNVEVILNEKYPKLSKVCLAPRYKRQVETLKVYTYEAVIDSNRVKLAEFRGKQVVAGLFEALAGKKGRLLLPNDVAKLHDAAKGNAQKEARLISDFIAGMTDRYAVEFYGRLHSDSPQTIFKEA